MNENKGTPNNKLRVLIADDVQETRRSTRLMLSMHPDVEVAAIAINGRQAIDMALEHHPDIVVLDINMPEIDGLSAFEQISKVYPDIGCIIISAQRTTDTLRSAMSVGAQEYLIKPFTVDELNAAVDKVGAKAKESKQRMQQADLLREKSEIYLKQLADEYSQARRTDDEAMEVFELLAANPLCEIRWLRTLAMLYIVRHEWTKLKNLAARLEKLTQPKND
ncbi:MAG: response regulator [Anaerolineales bacterium]|nr:response regulator [Anaerolineales bacterium]